MMYAFLRGVMRTIVRVYLGRLFRITGREVFPRTGPVVVCANHASTVDPPLVPAYLPRDDSWSMAKAEWFARRGPSRWMFRQYHAFPIVRHSPDRRGVRQALEILRGGGALVVYPEGTRVPEGGLQRAEPGAGFLARTSGATVQPIALVGTRECFPKGARWPRRVPVEMRFAEPLVIRSRRPDGRRIENQEAADAIMLAIAELLPAEMRGEYGDLEDLRRRLDGVAHAAGRADPHRDDSSLQSRTADGVRRTR